MAELGIAAGIVGLIGTGAKLSVLIFDFASEIGSAQRDLLAMGKEISLFCTVLEQLHNALGSEAANLSEAAISTVTDITERCQEILEEISVIVDGLVKSRGPDLFPSMDLVNKVKWTFKKPRVHVLQSTLESCKLTLVIMLTTSKIARKVSSSDTSKSLSDEISREQVLAQSLLLSNHCTIQQLGALEEESDKENDIPSDKTHPASITNHRPETDEPLSRIPTRQERASAWLHALLPGDGSLLDVHPGSKYRRASSIDASLKAAELLRFWTLPSKTNTRKLPSLSTRSPFKPSSQGLKNEVAALGRTPTELVSPTTAPDRVSNSHPTHESSRTSHDSSLPTTEPTSKLSFQSISYSARNSAAATEPSKSKMPVNIRFEPPCADTQSSSSKLLMEQVKRSIEVHDTAETSLAIAYGGSLRDLSDKDVPSEVFGQLEKLNLNPILVLNSGITLQGS